MQEIESKKYFQQQKVAIHGGNLSSPSPLNIS
jgi:hypothetical protein